MRRLDKNELGPEGGKALAEALKSNTALKTLWSATLQSNPLARAQRHASMYSIPFLVP